MLNLILKSFILNHESLPHLKELHLMSEDGDNLSDLVPAVSKFIALCTTLEYFEFDAQPLPENDFAEYGWVEKLKGLAFDARKSEGNEDIYSDGPLEMNVKVYSTM